MKKVLFLVTQSEMGGAQRYIYEISRALNPEKYKVLVAAGEGDGELFQKLKNTPVQPVYLKRMKRVPNPFLIISAIAEIMRLLKKERPDVLFLCSTTAGLLGSIAGGLASCAEAKPPRIIYRIGGWAFRDPRPFWKNWLIFQLEKITARFKDLIIVNSEYDWRIAVEKRIVSPEKIIKIYNGINLDSLDLPSVEEARNRLKNRLKWNSTVGCVANFYKTKGLEYLIGAFARPGLRERPGLKLLIIGEGRLRPQFEAQIKKLGLKDRVILTGRIPDAYKYLKAFDVFVLPSLKEGFPWIILEAMAAELPIIATNVGALTEIIENGKEGFLIETKNSQALAEKIKWLLEHQQEAKIMGIQAKLKLAKQFSLKKMVDETERLF